MRKKSGYWGKEVLFIYFFLLASIVGLVLISPLSVKEMKLRHIPRLEILLRDSSLDEVNGEGKEIRYYGNQMILSDGVDKVFEDVEFKGRGNASWQMDKKSYRVKTNKKIDLLGLGKVKKWGLVSNGIDDTLMRNDLAYHIGNLINNNYRIGGDYVMLAVNGQELGLYYMTKLVGIGKSTIDLREKESIIVELDNAYCRTQEMYAETSILGDCLAFSDSSNEGEELNETWEAFLKDYNSFEKAIVNGDYKKASNYVDMASLADYYLLGEFASNPDMFVTSWYMFKDGIDDKIHYIIAWDYDAAFGNTKWGDGKEEFYSPDNTMARLYYAFNKKEGYKEGSGMGCRYEIDNKLVSPLLCYAIDIPEFKNEVNRAYKEKLQNKREEIIKYIRDRADYIREAAIVNNEMWGMGDFDEAVNYLIWWVGERFDYFDENYTNKPFEMETREF